MSKQAAQEFGVGIFTISYWLKRLGYSYKKRLHLRGSKRRQARQIIPRGDKGYRHTKPCIH